MQKSDVIREIASVARQDHGAALFLLGWLVQNTSQEDLDDLLVAARGAKDAFLSPGHYEAYRERWGRIPGL